MTPTENRPSGGGTPLPKRVVGTFDNTIDTAETVINGKQNDTATLQSTDTLLLKHRPTLNGTSCLPNPRCPIELQVLLGYTNSYLALMLGAFRLAGPCSYAQCFWLQNYRQTPYSPNFLALQALQKMEKVFGALPSP